MRAIRRGEAASAWEVQSVPPGLALAVRGCAPVRGLFAKLRTFLHGFQGKTGDFMMGPSLMPEALIAFVWCRFRNESL